MSQQQKPVIPPKKTIWMKCRAGGACEGNQAYCSMVFKKGLLQGGGTSRRYRCLTCNGSFVVTV